MCGSHFGELLSRAREPLLSPRKHERVDAPSVTGKQRCSYIKTGFMQMRGEKAECLRCVPKTMQEENPV
jgi:hypothetical protein